MTHPTELQTRQTTSADGTTISYRTSGSGEDVIVVPGALAVAADLDGFAAALGTQYRVHTLDRRGRSTSGPKGPDYSIEREVEDLAAVQEATGARLLIGHSFGGLVALEAMRVLRFDAAAVYEPGVMLDGTGSVTLDWADRCRRELAAGKALAAFISFVRGVNPATTGKAPRLMLRLILPIAIGRAELTRKLALLDEAVLEHEEAARLANRPERYTAIGTPTLLMAGKGVVNTASGRATVALSRVLPTGELRTYPKLDHFGLEQAPVVIARDMHAFFAAALSVATVK